MSYSSAVGPADFHPDTREFFKDRRVLVLGGSGFIGSHVVEQLLMLGARPIVLTRSAAPAFLETIVAEIELVRGSLDDFETTLAATRRASVVINLAAAVAGIRWNAAHPASMFMNNMGIFFNSLRAAKVAGVDRYLVTSSACVYPRFCSIPTPEEEGVFGEPEPTNEGYGWAKRMEEFLGRAAAAEFGLSVAIARPYNAYGPRDNFGPDTSHVLPALIRKAIETQGDTFPVWGDGSHSRSFLYVDDFARGLIEVAARYAKADPVNIGTAEETTICHAAELIAAHVAALRNKPLHPEFNPAELTGQPRRACDTRKALAILQYRACVPLDEGLRRTIEWYFEHAHHVTHSHA